MAAEFLPPREALRSAPSRSASGLPLSADAWRDRIDSRLRAVPAATTSAAAYLEEVAKVFAQVAIRSIVHWRMQPAAAATDPDVAKGYEAAMRERSTTMRQVAERIPALGLRSDLDQNYIAHTLWAIASPET